MSRKSSPSTSPKPEDYRHPQETRKNNPAAGDLLTPSAPSREPKTYQYDPHLDPQLVWAGKAEHTSFTVDTVPLHIHEWVSAQAILEAARRPEPIQPDLFGETPLPADKQIEYYQHDVSWTNRLILGDSLLVMNSLLQLEGMAGKVQMIYIDPPYGIKYASNFQPRIKDRDVKERDEDLTRQPEQIRAYRDTWQLGIHSYLTYLRDRLLLARELLADTGSIFVQINDENLHLVRCLLDEVFGRENFVSIIYFATTSGFATRYLSRIGDYLLWYARDKSQMKYRQLFLPKKALETGDESYSYVQLTSGFRRPLSKEEREGEVNLPDTIRLFRFSDLQSKGAAKENTPFSFQGRVFHPLSTSHWKAAYPAGMERLREADRIEVRGNNLNYIRFVEDFPVVQLKNVWIDTGFTGFSIDKKYVVETNSKVIERCILMTTDPGDLVFDPTCGSGTTAYCAEKWGRRWITCDTSRVALAIARHRLLTAKYDYYRLKDPARGPSGGFVYKTVPHITLQSISQNEEIDEIAARYQPQIDEALRALNEALRGQPIRIPITTGARKGEVVEFSVQEAEPHPLPDGTMARRNQLLEWEVPREMPHPAWPQEAHALYWELQKAQSSPLADSLLKEKLERLYQLTGHVWESLKKVPPPVPGPDWPPAAVEALRRFWELKRQKRQAIDESIQRRAEQKPLYDRPKTEPGIVRVTGPFTVEAIPVPAVEDPTAKPTAPDGDETVRVADAGGDFLFTMLHLLQKQKRVLFPNGQAMLLRDIRPLALGYLHAEAETEENGQALRVAISFGPPYGALPPTQIMEAVPAAKLNGYQILLFLAFSFDPEAQALQEKIPTKGLQILLAHIAPDVLVGDLLKTTSSSQLFTVFGQPDVKVQAQPDGTFVVELRGVDVYDPVGGAVRSTHGREVPAWFLDTDYNGRTFRITQAFFPAAQKAWHALEQALKSTIDPAAFEHFKGTKSLPFRPGERCRIAVKVIDDWGNELLRVVKLKQSADEPQV